jgi:hypothetical protein
MRNSKSIIEKSIEVITENAEHCSDLAKMERASADAMHMTAHNLERLGHALEVGAADLKNELKAIPK